MWCDVCGKTDYTATLKVFRVRVLRVATKVVKEYALLKEMPCRALNMESFGQNMFISSQLKNRIGSLVSLFGRFLLEFFRRFN